MQQDEKRRLEFIGDAIVLLAVRLLLNEMSQHSSVGVQSIATATLVSNDCLARVAQHWECGESGADFEVWVGQLSQDQGIDGAVEITMAAIDAVVDASRVLEHAGRVRCSVKGTNAAILKASLVGSSAPLSGVVKKPVQIWKRDDDSEPMRHMFQVRKLRPIACNEPPHDCSKAG